MKKYDIHLDASTIKIFWVVTILGRIIILFFPIGLSDDIYRYVWDGFLSDNGINPFQYAPNAVELISIRPIWFNLINNAHISTPYPAFAQIFFLIVTSFGLSITGSILVYRIIFLLFDLLLIRVLLKLLDYFEMPKRRVLIYAWSPLAVIEFAGNAHNDILASVLLFSSLYLTITKSRYHEILSPIALSLAILTKYYPIIALPFIIRYWSKKQGFIFTGITLSLPLLFYEAGINVFIPNGQRDFIRYFKFNEGIFRLEALLLQEIMIEPQLIVVAINSIVLGSIVLFLLKINYKSNDPIALVRSTAIIIFLGLILGANIQPWYLLWILPFIVFFDDYTVPLWSLLAFLSYEIYVVYDNFGIWEEKLVILLFEYIPVYIILFYNIYKKNFFKIAKSDKGDSKASGY